MEKLRFIGLCMFFGAILLAVIGYIYGTVKSTMDR